MTGAGGLAASRAGHAMVTMRVVTSGRGNNMMMQVLIVENDAQVALVLKDIVELDQTHSVTGIAIDLAGA
ncbi:MAG: hypothetical protein LH610_04255, partial [Sphingomonas bacterium]|nr:hypothetical protein [Sphingomonas bacterium]